MRLLFTRLCALMAALFTPALLKADQAAAVAAPKLDTGDTAWVLVSSAMVLLMTPGLALFYAGMVRKKNVLSTMMQSMFMMGLISVLWVWYGYSLAFSPGHSMGGFIGTFEYLWLQPTVFYDVGHAFFDRPGRPIQSYGVGIRLSVPQVHRLVLRFDIALTPGAVGLSLGMNELFQPHRPL